MSLASRLVGFGLCLVGGYLAAFAQSLHSTGSTIGNIVTGFITIPGVAPTPAYQEAVLADIASYVQQNVTNPWLYYLAIGVALAIVGTLIVGRGDPKPAKTDGQAPVQQQPVPANSRE